MFAWYDQIIRDDQNTVDILNKLCKICDEFFKLFPVFSIICADFVYLSA